MASLGDLVVKIGADTRDLNKQLGKVQREMRGMTSNITNLGKSMTRSFTLPLAALGAAAVKSAADLETLETSFVSLTGSAEAAAMMVEDLNKFTAETPFQLEAVGKAARQLIAAGAGINDVNTQLQFLGDIAATSGSSIDEIAAIFAKVQAKGKVELETLNQLAERGIPIFTALSEATGLLPSELGAGRVSVEQFNKTLQSFAEEGGFAEGAMSRLSQTAAGRFSTAMDNIKLALASLGELFLPVINRMLEGVVSLAQGFANLSPFVQRIVVVVGTFVSAIGPLLYIVPQLITAFTALRAITLSLNIAMLANPALAVAAGIAALAAVVVGYNVDVGNAVQTTHDWRIELLKLNNEQKKIKLEGNIASANDALKEHTAILDRFRKLRDAAKLPSEQAKWQRAMDQHQLVIDDINNTLDEYQTELVNVKTSLKQAADAQRMFNDATNGGNDTLGKLFSKLEEVQVQAEKTSRATNSVVPSDINEVGGKFFSFLENVQVQTEATTRTTNQMGQAMVNAFGNAAASAESFSGFAIEAIKGVIMAYLAEAKTRIIANSAEGAAGTGPAYPFVMAGLIATGMALLNRISIPELAEGGLASGPTMAIVGDNRNAAIDPEVISPLSKLKDMMGGSQVEVFGRISGNDIFLSNTRSGFKRNRYS